MASLRHVWWHAQATLPSIIISAISLHESTLTGLTIWRHALSNVHLFPSTLQLREVNIVATSELDEHCEDMVDHELLPPLINDRLPGEDAITQADRHAASQNEIFQADMRSLRTFLERNAPTLENITLQACFGHDLNWPSLVFGTRKKQARKEGVAISSRLSFPNLRVIKLPAARLNTPTFYHMLRTSPDIESLCIHHLLSTLPPPASHVDALSTDSASDDDATFIHHHSHAPSSALPYPIAPEGTLTKLKICHYRATADRPETHAPVEASFNSFLAGTHGRPLLQDLEIGSITGKELINLFRDNDFSELKYLDVFITTEVSRQVLVSIVKGAPKLTTLVLNANDWKSISVSRGYVSLFLFFMFSSLSFFFFSGAFLMCTCRGDTLPNRLDADFVRFSSVTGHFRLLYGSSQKPQELDLQPYCRSVNQDASGSHYQRARHERLLGLACFATCARLWNPIFIRVLTNVLIPLNINNPSSCSLICHLCTV